MRPVRGRAPRLPRPRRAPAERGRRRRAAQGPRGAAAVRGDRARRRRARAAAADDPLALPARPVPAALAARCPDVRLGAAAGAVPEALRRRPRGRGPARPGRAAARRGGERPARGPASSSRAPPYRGRPVRRRRGAACRSLGFARAAGDRAREAAAAQDVERDRTRARAARAPGCARCGARGDPRGARPARQLVPRRRRGGGEPRALRSTPTGSSSSTDGRQVGPAAAAAPRRPSSRPGGASSSRYRSACARGALHRARSGPGPAIAWHSRPR